MIASTIERPCEGLALLETNRPLLCSASPEWRERSKIGDGLAEFKGFTVRETAGRYDGSNASFYP